MDAAPRTTLNLRLADACRVEQHGLLVLEAITANRKLPRALRDRAELHHVETQAQLGQTLAALVHLAPSLARRLQAPVGDAVDGQPGIEQWIALERREISAYQGVLGEYSYDDKGNRLKAPTVVNTFKDGKPTPLSSQ